jgi:dihydrofolate synthase/folylpolyglutamate synthase
MKTIANLQEAELALEPFWPANLRGRTVYTTEYMERFMEFVHDPQNKPRVVHIAGTSGKTSTAYYVASLLKQAGKRVGLMTSPHIEALSERAQVDLEPLPEAEFCSELSSYMDLVWQSGITLSYAEIIYGFAFWEFVRQRVDYIVVEVGMGGLLDATNVIDREDKVSVITDIGLDHTNVLGDSLEEIARHKAGIIRLHNSVFMHRQDDAVMGVVREVSMRRQADLHIVERTADAPGFLPLFQRRNFSLATNVVSFILQRDNIGQLTPAQISDAARVHIPARMEQFRKKRKIILLDNAHNPQKLHALREAIDEQYPNKSIALMLAFVAGRGRNTEEMIEAIIPVSEHVIATTIPAGSHNRGSCDPDEIADICGTNHVAAEAIDDTTEAYHALLDRPEDVLVVTGSTYLLEHIRPLVRI